MADTCTFTYNSSLNQSYEGRLASKYTNWVTSEVKAAGDYIAWLWYQGTAQTPADLAKAIEISRALQAGTFSVNDLFLAAQTKGTTTISDIAGVPTPEVTVLHRAAVRIRGQISFCVTTSSARLRPFHSSGAA